MNKKELISNRIYCSLSLYVCACLEVLLQKMFGQTIAIATEKVFSFHIIPRSRTVFSNWRFVSERVCVCQTCAQWSTKERFIQHFRLSIIKSPITVDLHLTIISTIKIDIKIFFLKKRKWAKGLVQDSQFWDRKWSKIL